MTSTLLQSISPDRALLFLPLEEANDQLLDGVNLVTDGDMEDPGTAAWTPVSNPIVTKETGSPYAGSRYLRVAYNGTPNPYVRQVCLVSGHRYRVAAALRNGPPAAAATLSMPLAALVNYGANWWYGQNDYTAGGTGLDLVCSANTPGSYAEFDQVSAYELRRATPNLGQAPGAPRWAQWGDGFTSSTFPTLLNSQASARYPRGVSVAGDRVEVLNSGAGSVFDFTGFASFTVCALVRNVGTNGGRVFSHSAGASEGFYLDINSVGPVYRLYTPGTGSTNASTTDVDTRRWITVCGVCNGVTGSTQFYTNGVRSGTPGSYPNNGLVSSNTNFGVFGSVTGNNMQGEVLFPSIYPFAFGDAQAMAWHRMAQGWRRLRGGM